MTEMISIVKTRDNELEFDINITGAQKKAPQVRLVIEHGKIDYTFECKNLKGEKWVCAIPPMPQLTKTSYSFRLEVIIDGYFFEPYRKTLNVIPEPVVKSGKVAEKHPEKPKVSDKTEAKPTAPKKKTVVKKRTESKPVVTKEEAVIEQPAVADTSSIKQTQPADDFASMAAAWMNRTKPVLSEQDKKVKSVIKDALEKKAEFVPPVSALEPEPIVVQHIDEKDEKARLNDIKIKAILDSTKIK
jgi:hypothetical protein